MSITATNTGGSGGILAPVGNHIARCFAMIDLGTSADTFQGKTKIARKVLIKWELPNALHVFKEGEPAKPFSVQKEFTVFMNDKANLRKALESWRGKPFTDEEAKSFDITKVLGAPCMLNVIEKLAASGNTYNDITSVSPIPKGPDGKTLMFEVPAQVNPMFEFSFEQFSAEKMATLPDWIQNKIKASNEYKSIQSPGTVNTPDSQGAKGLSQDDLPF